eukprot:11056887-Ditylum_brightwellii.AAC.1
MKKFASAEFTNKELAVINQCRLFSQAATLLDIASGDGKYIIADTLQPSKKAVIINFPPINNWVDG